MGVRVYRNNTTRKDAVYVVRAIFDGTDYTVCGWWGKWADYENVNHQALQRKTYYTGPKLQSARTDVSNLMTTRVSHGYILVPEYSTPFPWETSTPATTAAPAPGNVAKPKPTAKPKPATKPAPSKVNDDPQPTRRFTRGGLLELD